MLLQKKASSYLYSTINIKKNDAIKLEYGEVIVVEKRQTDNCLVAKLKKNPNFVIYIPNYYKYLL